MTFSRKKEGSECRRAILKSTRPFRQLHTTQLETKAEHRLQPQLLNRLRRISCAKMNAKQEEKPMKNYKSSMETRTQQKAPLAPHTIQLSGLMSQRLASFLLFSLSLAQLDSNRNLCTFFIISQISIGATIKTGLSMSLGSGCEAANERWRRFLIAF